MASRVLNTTIATEVAAGGAHAHGATRVSGSLIACNSANVSGEEAIAAGALAILGESLMLIDSTIQGNTASASGSGSTAEQQIFFEGTISNQNSTITNDTSGCVAPPSPAPTPIPVSPNFTG